MPKEISFLAWGKQFRPSQINYVFTECNDPGDIGKSGRYKGKPVPYGSIVIKAPSNVPNEGRITYIVRTVHPLLSALKEAGATESFLDIARYYSTQCNESYSSEELALMASLNCDVLYSAYLVSEEEEKELTKSLG